MNSFYIKDRFIYGRKVFKLIRVLLKSLDEFSESGNSSIISTKIILANI